MASSSGKLEEKLPAQLSEEELFTVLQNVDVEKNPVFITENYAFVLFSKAGVYVSYDPKDILGIGSDSIVRKAWSLDLVSGEFSTPALAVKCFKNKDQLAFSHESDLTILALKGGAAAVHTEKNSFLCMPYLPYPQLLNDEGELHPLIAKLSLIEKFNLIIAIIAAIEALHKADIIHGDIKGQNILIEESAKGEFKIYIIDYGNALFSKKDELIITSGALGSKGRLAPEATTKITEKTDIFAIVPDLMQILGADDPLKEKKAVKEKDVLAEVKKEFNPAGMKNMFKSFAIPVSHPVQFRFIQTVQDFLLNMANPEVDKRPSATEALEFFKAARNILGKMKSSKSSFFAKHFSNIDLTAFNKFTAEEKSFSLKK